MPSLGHSEEGPSGWNQRGSDLTRGGGLGNTVLAGGVVACPRLKAQEGRALSDTTPTSIPQEYADFLASKAPRAEASGIEPSPFPGHVFDFQAAGIGFALRQGRAGIYFDTGLGKTIVELEWCRQAAVATNGAALILTPLAVARQMEREAHRFGYEARVIRDQSQAGPGINICNYDRLGLLDPSAFGAVALDEADILCNFAGSTSQALKAAFANHRFRLCATATPAPNDPTELAEHAEFLGIMQRGEMLMRWFINDTNTASQHWRLKGHAVQSFYDWLASWSRMAENPADIGFDGSRFALEPFRTIRHKIEGGTVHAALGELFAGHVSATGMHEVKRQTSQARAEAAASLVRAEPDEAWLLWCDIDAEADALRACIPNAAEVRGSHTPERKEETIAAFQEGREQILITKPTIAGAGINLQRCARVIFVGRTFSYRHFYQAVRRCWRFGQTRRVHVHIIVAEGEDQIGRVIERKAENHVVMKAAMRAAMQRDHRAEAARRVAYKPVHTAQIPSWLVGEFA